MEVRETSADKGFEHVGHPLLHQQVRDPSSDREGRLMAVVREPLGNFGGRQQYSRTAYVRGADGVEFTAAPDLLEQV
ncbi:hypothetical protein ABZY44_27025 [Streptomyces sp. NPDC006544]|uniref:hypothetical protein n=1 Tax=Streptomyces sp. NPDC006544 TaxID=3154583 RepID=UPI0033B06F23